MHIIEPLLDLVGAMGKHRRFRVLQVKLAEYSMDVDGSYSSHSNGEMSNLGESV